LALLSSLQMNTPSAANAQHYAELVREKAQQRRLISVAGEIVDEAYVATEDVVGLIDEAERKINAIGDAGRTDTVSPLQRLLLSEADILEERGETRGRINGLETGYKSLDQTLQGLQPSSMTIVGARPGTGKTAFALGILIHVGAVVKRPALFFSLEMSRQELAERILASTARIDSSKLRTGDLSDADWNRAHEAFGYLQSAKVFIDDNPALTVMDVRARARRIRQQNGDLGVVIIDYLQLMSSRGRAENRQVEVSEMSRSLKILARELQCPVIALSQLSRKLEERADKSPDHSSRMPTSCCSSSVPSSTERSLTTRRPKPKSSSARTETVRLARHTSRGAVNSPDLRTSPRLVRFSVGGKSLLAMATSFGH
jgi:replicative DNA helicase